ncbi:hypothetical protein ODJ79_09785, partial [Actinoplanes sp. KI2]|uniref:hypothetical protein n=1 Tax=Actinoplanes sp. KI2 TaxID=2983315 RepID=UPI0021D59C32
LGAGFRAFKARRREDSPIRPAHLCSAGSWPGAGASTASFRGRGQRGSGALHRLSGHDPDVDLPPADAPRAMTRENVALLDT